MRSIVTKIFLSALLGWSFATQAQADNFEEFRHMKTGWRQIWLDPADPRNSRSLCKDQPKSFACKAETMLTCEFRNLPELCRAVAEETAMPNFSNGPLPRPSGDYLRYRFSGRHVNSRKEASEHPELPLRAEGVASVDIIFSSCFKHERCPRKVLDGDTYHLHRVKGEWWVFIVSMIPDEDDAMLP